MNNIFNNILNLIADNKENIDEEKVASTIAKGMTFVLDKFNLTLPRKELEEVAQLYSQRLDELILKEEEQKNYRYVGGDFIILYDEENKFKLKIVLYFNDADGNWIETTATSRPKKLQYLTDTAIAELQTKKQVTFDIEGPKK